jgi:hypothetical protein
MRVSLSSTIFAHSASSLSYLHTAAYIGLCKSDAAWFPKTDAEFGRILRLPKSVIADCC